MPPSFFPVSLAAARDLTPGFRRLTFTGESLRHFADPGYDQRIKLIFPIPGRTFEELLSDEDWYGTWRTLPDEQRHPFRTYTTRAVRPEEQELDVDVVVHEPSGPASRWIDAARPGDELLIFGPDVRNDGPSGGVDFVPPQRTERFFLAGDETAAPAIAVILEQLDRDARGIAVVEVPHVDDIPYLPRHPGIEVRAVARGGRPHGSVLIEHAQEAYAEIAPAGQPQEIEEIDLDETLLWEVPRHAKGGAALKSASLYAWLAGEADAVKSLRRHLVAERGLDRRAVAFMGYWRVGRAEN